VLGATETRDQALKHGELNRFYVNQIETGDAYEFDRKSEEELRDIIATQDEILAALSGGEGEPSWAAATPTQTWLPRSGPTMSSGMGEVGNAAPRRSVNSFARSATLTLQLPDRADCERRIRREAGEL
jgi:hypothetical protein